jgi:hypothetical protein
LHDLKNIKLRNFTAESGIWVTWFESKLSITGNAVNQFIKIQSMSQDKIYENLKDACKAGNLIISCQYFHDVIC